MNSLEEIKESLQSNPNLNDGIKSKLFELVAIFHKKIPEVNLSKLNEKLKTVKFNKMSKFERKGVYYYDLHNNEILFKNDISEDIIENFKNTTNLWPMCACITRMQLACEKAWYEMNFPEFKNS